MPTLCNAQDVTTSDRLSAAQTLLLIILLSPVGELLALLLFALVLTRVDPKRTPAGRLRPLQRVNPPLHSLWWDQRPARKESRKLDRNLDWPISLEENAAVVLDELESSAFSSS